MGGRVDRRRGSSGRGRRERTGWGRGGKDTDGWTTGCRAGRQVEGSSQESGVKTVANSSLLRFISVKEVDLKPTVLVI